MCLIFYLSAYFYQTRVLAIEYFMINTNLNSIIAIIILNDSSFINYYYKCFIVLIIQPTIINVIRLHPFEFFVFPCILAFTYAQRALKPL